MPTVDLFIMAKERCSFSGMHVERPVIAQFGHASWTVEAVYEYTKEMQDSGVAAIGGGLARSLGPEIQAAIVSAIRQVQIKHLEREKPKPPPNRIIPEGGEPGEKQEPHLLRCHACSHSKVEKLELRCGHHLHPGVVARLPFDGGNWGYVAGCTWAADCGDYPGEEKEDPCPSD